MVDPSSPAGVPFPSPSVSCAVCNHAPVADDENGNRLPCPNCGGKSRRFSFGQSLAITVQPSPFFASLDENQGLDSPDESVDDEEVVVRVPQEGGSGEATRAKARLWAMVRATEALASGIGPDDFDKNMFIAKLHDLATLVGFSKRNRRDLENDAI